MSDDQSRSEGPSAFAFPAKTGEFYLAVLAIRRAQKKPNPWDFEPGTPEWQAAVIAFTEDLLNHGYLAQQARKSPDVSGR
ncbi:hypothetical protein [Caballeronia sp. RCC_10]|uniref:hypothetical protein n=1 Tax=Caballeronia sp. RCC_10 TaxID=3239227 RepID=UPI0035252C62